MKKNENHTPPQWAIFFLLWFCREELVEEIEGDLKEFYIEDLSQKSRFRAKLLYSIRVLSFFKMSNIQFIKSGTNLMLWKNYLLIANRNLMKHKGHTIFNLFGLTIGLCASVLMIMYVLDELSYDKHLSNYDRIYRVAGHIDMENNEMRAAISPGPLGLTMSAEIPGIEAVAAFTHFNRLTINVNEEKFTDPDSRIVSRDFLNVFDLPLVAGNSTEIFDRPKSLLISESRALSFFGGLDIIGTAVEVDGFGKFTITGIMKDPPENTHFRPQLLFYNGNDLFEGGQWKDHSYYTYILLEDGTGVDHILERLPIFYEKHMGQPVKENFSGTGYLFLQKLTNIHLNSDLGFELEPNGKYEYVLAMALLAVFIVLVVCINYMNMATAQATRRVKEVGIRKVLGSNRRMLMVQFFTESSLITLISSILALLLVPVLLPYFNFLADKSFDLNQLVQGEIIFSYVIIILITGILGGSYPAIFLSRFKVDEVMKKSYSLGGFRMPLSKVLSAFQFVVALVMIMLTFTVQRQIEYARNKDLGFDKENVLRIDLKNRLGAERTQTLQNELLANPAVLKVAAAMKTPGDDIMSDGLHFEQPDGTFTSQKTEFNAVNENFISTLNIELVAGRDFEDQASDKWGYSVIANETLVKNLGYSNPEDALGKEVKLPIGLDKHSKIVGVMKDAHMRSLHHEVSPHILVNFVPIVSQLLVKINGSNPQETLSFLEDKIKETTNSTSHTISFLDQAYWRQYQAEEKRGKIFAIFSSLVVLLAVMGLAGLVSFFIRFKAKELNIRKILGADFWNVLTLYAHQYIVQIVLAVFIAVPVSIYLIKNWLQNFAYHIPLPYDLLVSSSFALVVIIMLVVSFQCRRSFLVNPTKYLKED